MDVKKVLEWWLEKRMSGYTDSQYGKKEIRDLLNEIKQNEKSITPN